MGREGTGKFRSASQMLEAWELYKHDCDTRQVRAHGFSAKNSEFITAELEHRVTYTVKGFAVKWCGMTEQNFYATYAHNSKFEPVIARIKDECEVDAREKFELGEIDPRLAGLWMSNYGYSTKTDQNVSGAVPVVISGGDALED